ncbi:MAG: TolC family protein [Planctomycetaceae bacterium]
MTLDDLQRIALESNPTLRQAAWIVDKARGVRHQVGRYPNPTVGYQGQEMGNDGTAGQQGIFLQQTIVTGEKLRLGEQVLDHEIQALSWQVEAQRLRVLTDLELSYLDALGAQRRMKLADQLVQLAEQGVDVARQLVEAKEGARPDVLQAEILLSEVRIIRRNAQNDYEASWWRLAGIVGRPEMAAVSLAGDIEDEVEPRELERDYERLLAASPELQVAQARVQRAQALVRSQAAQPIPNILAQVGVAHDNSTGDEIAGVQIGLPIPVFNRNRGNIAAAHAEFHRACEDVERLRLALRVRLTRAYQEYIQARNQAELIEREILPRAEESRTLNEQAYRLGEFDFLRVLTARRTYFETNIRYIESLTELHKAAALIDGLLLTGGLDSPDDLSTDDGLRGQTLSNQ